ncbi:MAG: DUF2442 domain-containing protein [Lachnospiraceae bacterium]|nr:DUF2442 domain-containing protein [Lachnospiraceae bacterium]
MQKLVNVICFYWSDVKPYIQGGFYEQLKNEGYFQTVKVNGFSVEWPNEQDLCPDELYECSIKAD